MATTIYSIGDTATLSASFKNAAGAAADPTTVKLKIKTPKGVETELVFGSSAITNPAVGKYEYDLDLVESGGYRYRWIGTGAVKAARESTVNVEPTVFDAP